MKKVIFTALTGNYDKLEQPLVTDPEYDYVCLTDRDGRDGVWELRRIPLDEPNPILRARYAKLHPHLLLPEYDLSVFMDANLCIAGAGFYETVNKWAEEPLATTPFGAEGAVPVPFAVLQHPRRDCVWEELRKCYFHDKVSTSSAIYWHGYLKQISMPRHFGLIETNVLARLHNDPLIKQLDDKWWELLQLSRCTRDQLSFTPAIYGQNVRLSYLLPPGQNARNTDIIRYVNHPPTGKENIPGKINWANAKYNIRLLWRKFILLFLK